MDVEFLIVGGGAAGCALGWHLLQAGKHVLILEQRDARTKNKLCGGIVGVSGIAELKAVFGAQAVTDLALTYPPHVRSRCLDSEHLSPCTYATVVRKRLDDWLLGRFAEAGGVICDRARVLSIDEVAHTVSVRDLRTGNTKQIAYGTLIGADGALSQVRLLTTGRRPDTVIAIEGSTAHLSDDIVYAYQPTKRGYCWYIPAASAANVGCLSYGDDVRACRAWLSTFCSSMGIDMPALKGAPIPTGMDVLLQAGKHTYLVGDAAGLASPINGGGIHYALISARILAESLRSGQSYEDAMRPLVDQLAQEAAERDWAYLRISILVAHAAGRGA